MRSTACVNECVWIRGIYQLGVALTCLVLPLCRNEGRVKSPVESRNGTIKATGLFAKLVMFFVRVIVGVSDEVDSHNVARR